MPNAPAWPHPICPACPLARTSLEPVPGYPRGLVAARCHAPADIRQAYGYPSLCEHRGPFRDDEEASAWKTCPVLLTCARLLR